MPISRAGAWEVESIHGRDVWAILCRSALRGVGLAARILGLEATENRVERAELCVSYGLEPPTAAIGPRLGDVAVDWAKLGDLERGRVAREVKGLLQP
jgi:hypothetical protein